MKRGQHVPEKRGECVDKFVCRWHKALHLETRKSIYVCEDHAFTKPGKPLISSYLQLRMLPVLK